MPTKKGIPRKFAIWLVDGDLVKQFKAEGERRGLSHRAAAAEAVRLWLLMPAGATAARKLPASSAGLPKCRRCGHIEAQHWARGCIAGCICREFRAP